MLKKLSTFVLIGIISVMALAACGSGDDDNDAEPTVTRVPATNAPSDATFFTPTPAAAATEAVASPAAGSPEASPITEQPSPIVNPLGTPGSTEVASPVVASPVATEVVAATATATASPVASPAASPDASPETTAPGATALSVTTGDLFFDPKELAGAANVDVVITITNNGALAHDFSIPDLSITSKMLNPGESTTVTVNAPAGSYAFECTVPGHAEAGMVGTITLS